MNANRLRTRATNLRAAADVLDATADKLEAIFSEPRNDYHNEPHDDQLYYVVRNDGSHFHYGHAEPTPRQQAQAHADWLNANGAHYSRPYRIEPA